MKRKLTIFGLAVTAAAVVGILLAGIAFLEASPYEYHWISYWVGLLAALVTERVSNFLTSFFDEWLAAVDEIENNAE